MDKNIKILTVCNKGNCRSVGTRYCLYRRGYNNVIAIGCRVALPETLRMLCNWADMILLAEPWYIDSLPKGIYKKINKKFTIGEDIWSNPLNYRLHDIINKQLDLIGFI